MGIGYNYKCKRCGRKYSVTVGMPYLYPQAYRELRQQIWEYRQGLQPARAFRLMPRAAVKAERIVLYCENEGHWLAGYDCTLYLPNDPESISKDEVPFPDDLEKDDEAAPAVTPATGAAQHGQSADVSRSAQAAGDAAQTGQYAQSEQPSIGVRIRRWFAMHPNARVVLGAAVTALVMAAIILFYLWDVREL